eukprot:scaffold140422_cov87-Phaeocystis_antarctica.AAC.1
MRAWIDFENFSLSCCRLATHRVSPRARAARHRALRCRARRLKQRRRTRPRLPSQCSRSWSPPRRRPPAPPNTPRTRKQGSYPAATICTMWSVSSSGW